MRVFNTFLCLMLLAAMSCQEKPVTNEFGVTCTVIEKGDDLLVDSMVVGIYQSNVMYTGEEVTQKTPHKGDAIYQPLYFSSVESHPMYSFLKGRNIGDSVQIEVPYSEKTKQFFRETATEKTILKVGLRIVDAKTQEEYQKIQAEKQQELNKPLTMTTEGNVITNNIGVTCTIVESGSTPLPDSIVMGTYRSVLVSEGDKVVNQNAHNGPILYQPLSFASTNIHPVFSFLKGRNIGDSLIFEIPFNERTKPLMRDGAPSNTVIKFFMRIVDTKTIEAYKKEQEELERGRTGNEDKEIQDYLKKNGLSNKAKKLPSGIYVVVTEAKGGEKPKRGENVDVHYTGTLLNGTTPFDSSIPKGKPYSFALGTGVVIQGWDLGIPEFGVGDKGTIYIPSHLAYGPRGSGRIAPNSILKFDVELVSKGAPQK